MIYVHYNPTTNFRFYLIETDKLRYGATVKIIKLIGVRPSKMANKIGNRYKAYVLEWYRPLTDDEKLNFYRSLYVVSIQIVR